MHESFIRNSIDGSVAGTRTGGRGSQACSLVRTELYAYTAYLKGTRRTQCEHERWGRTYR